MKGQVLDYSVQAGSGVISTKEGQRFSFAGSQWKGEALPSHGTWVDFEAEGGNAVAIYRSLSGDLASDETTGAKSKAAATLWAIFLGGFGAHKFYMGSWGWGIVYLLTCWLYVPFIVAFIEWIRYILMTDNEFSTKAEEFRKSGPFGFFW